MSLRIPSLLVTVYHAACYLPLSKYDRMSHILFCSLQLKEEKHLTWVILKQTGLPQRRRRLRQHLICLSFFFIITILSLFLVAVVSIIIKFLFENYFTFSIVIFYQNFVLILRSVRPRRDFPRAGRQVDGNGIDFSNAVFDEQTGNTLHSIYMYKEVSSVGWFYDHHNS